MRDATDSWPWAENDDTNNSDSATVTFHKTSWITNLEIVAVPYKVGNVTYTVNNTEIMAVENGIRRVFPIGKDSINVTRKELTPPYDGWPGFDKVNQDLALIQARENSSARYYGLLSHIGEPSDNDKCGSANGIPSTIASGSTHSDCNVSTAMHELSHTYGRHHAEFCDAGAGGWWGYPDGYEAYPYPDGNIGGPSDDPDKFYGFNVDGPSVIGPSTGDLMTYCRPRWLSDFTYEGIYSRMLWYPRQQSAHIDTNASGEHLVVLGNIVTPTNVVTLSTLYRMPFGDDVFGRISGEYSIRLLSSDGSTLADYPFTPRFSPEETQPQDEIVQQITEVVPWVDGTTRVAILHSGTTLATREVSANTPVVTVLSPNGGETLGGSSVTLSWSASDADGDPLTFSIDYSTDGGATWQGLRSGLTGTEAVLALDQLPGTDQGLFRVWASDSINTGIDQSDAVFTVERKTPSVSIFSPAVGATFVPSQTITFEGSGYDLEDGMLTGAQLSWTSSLAGPLGTGRLVQRLDLITGTHYITLTATDSDGNTAETYTQIYVVESVDVPITETEEERIYLPVILNGNQTTTFEGSGFDLITGPHYVTLTPTDSDSNTAEEKRIYTYLPVKLRAD